MDTRSSRIQRASHWIATATVVTWISTAAGQAPSSKPTPTTTPTTAPAATQAPAALPSATEIFAKAVTAAGGADLIRQQTSRTLTGTIEMPAQSVKGTLVTKVLSPSMMSVETEIAGFGTFRQGIGRGPNGIVGWSIDDIRGASLMEADALARELRDITIEHEIDPASGCEEVEVVDRSDFRGTPCYKVRFKCGGDPSTRYYAVDSGHLVGLVRQAKTQLGTLEVTASFRDFAVFSGRTMARVHELVLMGQVQLMTFNSATFEPIDPSAFVLPKEIQTLANASQSKPPAALPPAVPPAPAAKK